MDQREVSGRGASTPEVDAAPQKKLRHPDRVTLKAEHLGKIDGWIAQVTTAHRGVRLTRNNMLVWMVDSLPAELSSADASEIARMHYDEERLLRDTLEELRKCRAEGRSFDWQKILINGTAKKNKSAKIRAHRDTPEKRET